MTSYRRVTLLLLGAAQFVVGIALLPLSLFFGTVSMVFVPLMVLWMMALGVRLQHPTATVRAQVRRTRVVVLPIAVLCMVYGVYALSAAQRSAESGGGLLGTFGLLPLISGLVAGCLSLVSLWVSGSVRDDLSAKSQ